MKVLPVEASDQEILDAVREWVGMLIEERYADACAFFYHDDGPYPWTPELIRTLIQNYGSLQPWPDEVFKVTSLDDATADPPRYMPPRHDVNRYQDDAAEDSEEVVGGKVVTEIGAGEIAMHTPYYPGYVWFDLPLNGYWSDLTATMDLCVLNNQLVFKLNDIHVM